MLNRKKICVQDFICQGKYEYDGCVPGYVCDQASGQCALGQPGEGDTQENCEASCNVPPSPTPQYACNVATFTCEESNSTSTSSETTCNDNCADQTPSDLIGLWRGLSVNQGFTQGEFVINFTTSSVSYGPSGDPASVSGKVATVGPNMLRITVTAPADQANFCLTFLGGMDKRSRLLLRALFWGLLINSFPTRPYSDVALSWFLLFSILIQAGNVKYASYASPGYPTGPETYSVTIALQSDDGKQAPPSNVVEAMGDTNFDVYVMSACNSYDQAPCNFASAFVESAKLLAKKAAAPQEKKGAAAAAAVAAKKGMVGSSDDGAACSGFTDCVSCTAGNDVCGWCDGIVYDVDGEIDKEHNTPREV